MKERRRHWFGYLDPSIDMKQWGLGLSAGFNRWDGWNVSVVLGPLALTWSTR